MRKRVLMLTTSAAILACGSVASAQAPGARGPSTQIEFYNPADLGSGIARTCLQFVCN